ncbi:hypothetical protein [Deinococcus aquaedulcis]|uniref:hypothetical protein n=1 Tax=Deinococcus aquaedulcis TaxID=2840455 RepID=UPI001C82DB0E|nr:hypothetical protein [Deinococcus aquaedulcis]
MPVSDTSLDNLTRERAAGDGESLRLSAYVTDPVTLAMLDLAKTHARHELSRVLGRELQGILEDCGAYYVSCPKCGAEHVECTVPQSGTTDRWTCPTCRKRTDGAEWLKTKRLPDPKPVTPARRTP